MPSSTSSSEPGSSWLQRGMSLLLPILIVGLGFLDALDLGAASSGESFIRSELVRRAATRPNAQVVLVGNSELDLGIDAELLERELGVPTLSMHVQGTSAPFWYAVVKNRVFGDGLRPRLVIVMGDVPRLMRSRTSPLNASVLAEQLEDDEPVIARKVFGHEGGSVTQARLQALRVDKRDAIVEGFKDRVVGWVFGADAAGPWAEQGESIAVKANADVFERPGAIDLTLRERVIPVAESSGKHKAGGSASESLVPDMLALGRKHDAQVVFLRAPLRSDNRAGTPSAAQLEGLRNLLAAEGVQPLLELSSTASPDSAFTGPWHLGEAGARVYTRALAQELKDLGLVGP